MCRLLWRRVPAQRQRRGVPLSPLRQQRRWRWPAKRRSVIVGLCACCLEEGCALIAAPLVPPRPRCPTPPVAVGLLLLLLLLLVLLLLDLVQWLCAAQAFGSLLLSPERRIITERTQSPLLLLSPAL